MESVVHNPMVPYNSYIHGGFRDGKFLRVQGRTNHNTHSLKINLMCGPSVAHDDIAFHLDARFSENVIIRNAKNHSSWGTEDRNGSFPLGRGESFEIMILCEGHQFKIAVNGQHFTEFNHRVPLERITHVGIEGDIVVTLVQFEGGSGSTALAGYSSSPSAPIDTLANSESYQSPPGGYPPPTGFVLPPPLPNFNSQSGSAYPPHSGGGYPPSYPPGPGYGQPPPGPGYGQPTYSPPPSSGYGPGYGQPPPGPGYYDQPHGGYPPPHGYPNQGYPQQGGSGSGGGLMGSAQKLLAGVGLAGVASKIPGLAGGGRGHGGHGYPGGGYPGGGGGQHGHGGGGGMGAGGILGSAAALGVGGALAAKMMKPKKMKKNKLLKYGLPLAGVGVGGYALSKGMKGFGRRGSWSSSSSSSSE